MKEYIALHSEKSYQEFSTKLLPGITGIQGVRLPILRKYVKEIEKQQIVEEMLASFFDIPLDELWFEEIMIGGMLIGKLKEIDKICFYVEKFIPYINNWSTCDSFCASLKQLKERDSKEVFWEFIQPYFKNDREFLARFAVVVTINYYQEQCYLEEIFKSFDKIVCQDYYAQMAISWALSMLYVKFPEETTIYIKTCELSDFTIRKSLQ